MDTYSQYMNYQDFVSGPVIGASFIVAVIMIAAMWKMFSKAGLAGWKSIIPLYNMYCLYEITFGKGKGWMFLLQMIPCVGFIINIFLAIKTAKAYGKGGGFAVGLYFLPFIFYMILGFGNAQYVGPAE